MKDGKHVILYVDDDPDFRDAMRTVLESNGYSLVEASTGEEGLIQYNIHTPDLIIVDLMMEEIDTGTSMVRDLRLAGCTVPIFMASSVGDALQTSTDTATLGLAGVLQKPLDFDNLLTLIRSKLP
jgi:two-component system nitrogen regulation response regulator NtrX